MNRRDFVTGLAASAFAGCATDGRGPAGAEKRPAGKPRFHVFSKMFQPPVTKSPEALCDLMAAAGCDGVQWTVRKGGHATPENVRTELPRLVKAAAARGLAVETICTGITDGNDPVAETICRTAADCGVRTFRTGYFFYDEKSETFLQSTDRIRKALDALAALAARTGLTAAYQNHSTWGPPVFGGSIWDLYACLKDHDPRHIGVEFDPMHACFENGASWRNGFARIAPWIAAVDLKDFHYALSPKDPKKVKKAMVAAGAGIVPWQDVRRLVRAHGTDPFYILHFEYDFDKTDLLRTVRTERETFARFLT